MKFDPKVLLKVVVAAVLSGGGVVGTQFLTDAPVDAVSAIVTALSTVLAYLKSSPLSK